MHLILKIPFHFHLYLPSPLCIPRAGCLREGEMLKAARQDQKGTSLGLSQIRLGVEARVRLGVNGLGKNIRVEDAVLA